VGAADRAGRLPAHPYALAFGKDDPRKNIATIIDSIRTLRQDKNFASLELVIIGGHAARRSSSHDSWIHVLPNVNDAERNHLMAHAEVFLYPSWYEGYGLPLHEAAALGIRRVASTGGALPETAPPGTIFANPAKPHHWTEAIKLALQTKPQTVQPTHTWDESAEKLHDILAKI
jgi:glycosyltransferase involved in cell wall biosynthesis